MPLFDILSLIPSNLQREIVDALVDFVSGQAKKFLGDQVADKLKKLKSDATFAQLESSCDCCLSSWTTSRGKAILHEKTGIL